MNQKQHIIPQVYLKQFGYQDKNGIWKVPTFNIEEIPLMNEIDKTLVRQSNIESLLREENIYDIPISKEDSMLLENFLKLTEDNYPQIINGVKKGDLTIDILSKLFAFISLLYVRTNDYRLIINQIIDNKDHTYINGIFGGDKLKTKKVLNLPKDSATNFLIAFSGIYVYKCLQSFKIHIIEAIVNEKWATTDNPVLMLCKYDELKRIDFMGVDTKILCPLTPDYLAFFSHKDSATEIDGYLMKINANKINKVNFETFKYIWNKLTDFNRITKYLIVPTERR